MMELRKELPDGCISDLTFDEWRAGELEAETVAVLERHLEGCQRCQQRHDAIEDESERFLTRFPKLELPERRARGARSLAARRSRMLAWTSGGVTLAAAAGLALLLGRAGDDPQAGPGSGVRTKGSSHIGFFVKHGDEVRAGGDGQVVHPGDQLRFAVSSLKPQHLAIFSLDGAHVATVYYPAGTRSAAIGVTGVKPLESSVVLDATLGEEKLYGVFCDAPFELEPVRAALAQQRALPPLPGCRVDELAIRKEKEP